jgi:organic radical activating enzyme
MKGTTAADGACSCGGLIEAAARSISPEELAAEIMRTAPPEVEGVTISGGEPMQQALDLYRLLCMLRAERPQWTRGMFSGYTASELMEGNYECSIPSVRVWNRRTQKPEYFSTPTANRAALWNHQIKDALDWAVFGRYDRNRHVYNGRPLCSSSNQFLYNFTYRDQDFQTVYEATINPDGLTQITGFPTSQVLHKR